jgi:zinc D-Ala-D-Ala carboxypeptidase
MPLSASMYAFSATDALNSSHCSLATLCHSDTAIRRGIDNQPDATARANLLSLADTLTDVAKLLGAPLTITSGFRCATLNAAVGGVEDSQHISGQAADFKCPQAGTPADIAHRIADSNIVFDQLILEYGRWVHLSIAAADETPRREVLHIPDKACGYLAGLPAKADALVEVSHDMFGVKPA